MKKIIVAGAGHGGLVSAILLARNGFDVTVIESRKRNALGYDWTDIFDLDDFLSIGIDFPSSVNFQRPDNMIFYSPSLIFKKNQLDLSPSHVKLERKVLYDVLIKNALDSGVKFVFNRRIVSPILEGKKVIGVKSFFHSYYADFVIDSCGIFSPLKKKLKKVLNLDFKVTKRDAIYTYRAGYKKYDKTLAEEKYRVYLFPNETRGISWVCDEGTKTDVFVGKFYFVDKKVIKDELYFLRKCNKISNYRVSGGTLSVIPVRKPMAQIIYDGYALVGDSAYMTIPLIGSGISLCAKAGKILADVLIKNQDKEYNVSNLWEYQSRFYKEIGYDLAFKSCLKDLVYDLNEDDIDFVFQNDIINDELISTITADDKLDFDINDLLSKGKKRRLSDDAAKDD